MEDCDHYYTCIIDDYKGHTNQIQCLDCGEIMDAQCVSCGESINEDTQFEIINNYYYCENCT